MSSFRFDSSSQDDHIRGHARKLKAVGPRPIDGVCGAVAVEAEKSKFILVHGVYPADSKDSSYPEFAARLAQIIVDDLIGNTVV